MNELRKEKIMELLAENETVEKAYLEKELGISPSTVQRDLIEMEREGLLVRTWGGAKRGSNVSIYKRSLLQEKIANPLKVIGEIAASKVKDGELIFMGAGKTTLAMAEYLTAEDITVITNGIPQLEALAKRNINVFLLCGYFKEFSRSVVGYQTVKMLETYHFDKAFTGVRGIDKNYQLLSRDGYEHNIKKICIQNAQEAYVLADHSKYNRTAMFVTEEEQTSRLNYITDFPWEGNCNFLQEMRGYVWYKGQK